jgi:hypothetical protein
VAVVVVESLLALAWPAPGVAWGALDLPVALALTLSLGAVSGLVARLLWRRAHPTVAWVPFAALLAPQLLRPLALPYAWDPVLSGALLLLVWLLPRVSAGLAAAVLLVVPVVFALGLERGELQEPGLASHLVPGGDRPDIILITVDTLRADAGLTLPEHDRWRVYEQAVSGAPWTLPAMISLFSGQPVREHLGGLPAQQGGGYTQPRQDQRWLPVALAERGYACGAFTSNPYLTGPFGFERGFERFVHADDFREPFGARRGYERALHQLTGRVERLRRERDSRVVAEVIAWLEQPADRPRFAWVHLLAPHEYSRDVAAPVQGWAPGTEDPDALRRAYGTNVLATQQLLEAMLAAVDTASTLVVFTADHGEQLGEQGVFGHGLALGDPELHVPLALRGPGIEPGRVATLVSVPDLGAVLLGLADRAGGPDEVFPSRELAPVGGLRRRNKGGTFALRLPAPDVEDTGGPEYLPDVTADIRARARSHAPVVRLDEQTRRALEALGYLD